MKKAALLLACALCGALGFRASAGEVPAISALANEAPAPPDPEAEAALAADSLPPSSTRWIKQLWNNGFHINDPGVDYPRFPRFCVDVYNWGDRVFNSYDPEYVVATGKNWKLFAKSFNWLPAYAFIFPHGNLLHVRNNVNADIGGYLCFMAVSVGYMFNANELVAHNDNERTNFNFNFTCALFTIDYTAQTSHGGARITRFGNYNDGRHINVPFNDISNKVSSLTALYFFNHRRYSHAAATCFSKYQLKSAATWIAGLYWYKQNVGFDFSSLPEDMRDGLPSVSLNYRFHYTDYVALGGFAYSWVLKPRVWLLNAQTLAGIGYKHTKEDNTDGIRDMVASTMQINLSAVYNHRSLFAGLFFRSSGSFYFNGNYTFLNTLFSLQATVGCRF